MASKVKISGLLYLGQDPETNYTPNGAMVVKFSGADTQRRGEQEITTWYNISCWGKLGETLNKLAQDGAIGKGSQVFVTGSFIQREYTDRQGFLRTSNDVNADDVYLTAGARSGDGGQGQRRRDPNYAPPEPEPPADTDEVPF